MKNKMILFVLLFLVIIVNGYTQNKGLNFQGVARNGNNVLLASQQISIRLSIIDESPMNPVALYTEIKTVTTNTQGLFSLVIGDGNQISKTGNYDLIDWSIIPKYLKIEIDPANGSNFSNLGTSQIQHVAFSHFSDGVFAKNIVGTLPIEKGGTGVNSLFSLKANLNVDNVNNTSDLEKPVSIATQNELNSKLNVNSPTANGVMSASGFKTLLGTANDFLMADGSTIQKSAVVFSGSYNDLSDKPILFSGEYNSLLNKPTLFSGNYSDLIGKPSLFSGSYNDLTDKPILFSGEYNSLLNKPTLFSGNYVDLIGKPSLFSGSYNDLTDKPILFSGEYNSLLNKPTLFSGNYVDLIGKPSLFSGSYFDLTDLPDLSANENVNNKSDDNTLGGIAPSDVLYPTQKAVKEYVAANNNAGGIADGSITTIKLDDAAVTDIKIANGISAAKVGLGNVDNTTDLNKPVSTATQTVLDTKLNIVDTGMMLSNRFSRDTISLSDRINQKASIDSAVFNNDILVSGLTFGRGGGALNTNIAVGLDALSSNTSGNYNNAFGNMALFSNTTGSHNVGLGHQTLLSNLGGSDNTAVGHNVLLSNLNGYRNIGMGSEALISNLFGSENNAIGKSALFSNVNGNFNIGMGGSTLLSNQAGNENTAIGYKALLSNINGNYNIGIGSNSNVASVDLTNAIAIGANAVVDASNKIQLGNGNINMVETSGALKLGSVTYPNTDGAPGQSLMTDGIGNLFWSTPSTSNSNIFNSITVNSAGGNPGIYLKQNVATSPTWLRVGNDGGGAEYGIVGASDQFFSGTIQGDIALKAFSSSADKKMFIGATFGGEANLVLSPDRSTKIVGKLTASGLNYPISDGSTGQVLQTDGNKNLSWVTLSSSTNASNILGGSSGQIPYQSNIGSTSFISTGSQGQILQSNGTNAPSWITPSTPVDISIGAVSNTPNVNAASITSGVISLSLADATHPGILSTNSQPISGVKQFLDGISVGSTNTETSAIVDINSSTKGLLIPRMTYDQKAAISNPASGLLIWCTDCDQGELQVYNGTSWKRFAQENASLGTPVFSTLTSSSLTSSTSNITSNVTTLGGNSVLSRGICYSTSTLPTIISSTVTIASSTGSSTTTLSGLSPNTTYYVRAYIITNDNKTFYGTELSFTTNALAVGDAYQGGKIAYIFTSTDVGYVAGEVHGIIAANNDHTSSAPWWNNTTCGNISINFAAGRYLGDGRQNTNEIIAACADPTIAANICSNYSVVENGMTYDDWYLPSEKEMDKLSLNRSLIGGFGDYYYWTSTYNAYYTQGVIIKFTNGLESLKDRSLNYYIRAIRNF